MGTKQLCSFDNLQKLVAEVHGTSEPVIVFDGEDECLVAMSPSVFERILFDTHLLNSADRESLAL